jgi:uncharacterized protein (TIGR04255 family)
MGKLLKSQPLVEALCEFRFSMPASWDLTLPGLFYAEVKEKFPHKESLQEFTLNIEFDPLKGGPPVMRAPQLRLWDEKRSASLLIGEGLLAVNQVASYAGWDNFKQLVQSTFLKYAAICQGITVEKIALRYINHIYPGTSEKFEIEDYITTMPLFPGPLDLPMAEFQQSYSLFVEDLASLLVHRTGIAEDEARKPLLLLDLELICSKVSTFEDDAVRNRWIEQWLENAHTRVEDAFIASLNPSYFESLR